MKVETESFIAGENLPSWAKSKGVHELRDDEGHLISVLVPTGVGTQVKKAMEGDTVVFLEGLATVIPKDVAKDYKN